MKAWAYDAYGDAGVLRLDGAAAVPAVGEGQVLVKVAAAALNPVDAKRRAGKFQATDSPLPVRLRSALLHRRFRSLRSSCIR